MRKLYQIFTFSTVKKIAFAEYTFIFFSHFSLDFHKRQTASMMRMGKRSVPDTDNQESADRIYRLLMNKRQTSSMMRMGKRSGKLIT